MSKLTILRGVSGSGKSTWATAQFGAVVVSRDSLRVALFGSDGPDYYEVPKNVLHEREELISKVEQAAIAAGIKAGKHVISDNTNVRPKFMKKIAALGYRLGAEVEVKVFDVPLATALQRNSFRAIGGGRHVPEKVIREQHGALQGTKNFVPERPYIPAPYHGTPGKPKAILVDIDGTLAHMRDHRGPFEWHNVGKDDVDENVAQVIEWIQMGMSECVYQTAVIVMSGRDEVCRPETTEWLNAAWVNYDELFMRPEGDMRPDNVVKAELFDKYVRDNYDVVMVFDDRNQVVDMWRSMGLKTLQVAEGDF